ncbi:MAG TPA: DUF4023 family protein [Niallia sp.]|nr:DUF4023 family protein [Niallia sp.]
MDTNEFVEELKENKKKQEKNKKKGKGHPESQLPNKQH